MEKYKVSEEYELRNVEEAPFTPIDKYAETPDFSLGINVCIYFTNKVGVNLEVEDGHIATADELMHFAVEAEEVGLTSDALDVLALWFVSPNLEIQLKPHHLPYKVRQQWPALLSKYTIPKDNTDFDDPILTFKRNVFYSKDKEVTLQDTNLLELLYEEAKFNILEGRYPCSEANYTTLASWQARIELGPYNPEVHTLAFWRSKLNKFLPRHARRSRWSIIRLSLGGKSGLEAKILEAFCNIASDMRTDELIKKYLQFCWMLPYYGSAFFHGQIETPVSRVTSVTSLVLGKDDKDVVVAINSEGVFLFDQEANEVILDLKYKELSWEFRKPSEPDNPDCLPCLFLQFAAVEDDKTFYKILQVFSKQAVMMDALITTFVSDIKGRQDWEKSIKMFTQTREPGQNVYSQSAKCDEVDGDAAKAYAPVLEPLASSSNVELRSNDAKRISTQLNRLSLATFNEEGECIDYTGSWKIS